MLTVSSGLFPIQLGLWQLASAAEHDDEILSNPAARPYTAEVDAALRPHADTLEALFKWEPGQQTHLMSTDVPVLRLVQSNQRSNISAERIGVVPFIGNLDLDTWAQIHNWIDVNIPGAHSSRQIWIGRYLVAHAITLLLVARMRSDDPEVHEDEGELLERAWQVQTGSILKDDELVPVDVDAECIRAFERRLFEISMAAGEAGFYQWGLDAGDHQDGWDPYNHIPSDWNVGDMYPDDMEELLQVCGGVA